MQVRAVSKFKGCKNTFKRKVDGNFRRLSSKIWKVFKQNCSRDTEKGFWSMADEVYYIMSNLYPSINQKWFEWSWLKFYNSLTFTSDTFYHFSYFPSSCRARMIFPLQITSPFDRHISDRKIVYLTSIHLCRQSEVSSPDVEVNEDTVIAAQHKKPTLQDLMRRAGW